MTVPVAERIRNAEEAFFAVIRRREAAGSASATDTWIGELCGGDATLCAEVKSLLSHLDKAGLESDGTSGFLNPQELHGSRAEALHRDAELEEWGGAAVGQRVGDFVIIGQLGAGGMGIVYVAEQQRPRRIVALKVIRLAVATPPMLVRFEREAELLGRLSHPGIAQIFAAGLAEVRTAERGQIRIPYIAMERIHGLPILDYIRTWHSTADQIVRLAIQICDAIEHAHQRGVIHRDLKPANLLVSDFDGVARVKVLDFGVARAVGGQPTEESLTRLTGQGNLVGTPAYMSPEQIAGKADAAGPSSDVYGIGAILYQLLTGHHAIDLNDCPFPEVARRVVECVPRRLGTIDRRLRGDLETIVAQTLEKDPARRYASAAELARDLRNFLDGRPIQARRAAWAEPCLKLLLRHRVALLSVALAAVVSFLLGWYAHSFVRTLIAPK